MRLAFIGALTSLWLLLWGDISPLLVLGGILVALIVTTVFPFPPAQWQGAFRPVAFVILTVRFAVDLMVASLQVAWLTLRPRPLGPSAVLEVQLHTRSELLLTLTGELVSLVPGSLLIELEAETGRMWLHILDGSTDLDRFTEKVMAQERRVIAALGSAQERDAYCSVAEEVS